MEWEPDLPVPGPLWSVLGYALGIGLVSGAIVGRYKYRVWRSLRARL